MNNADLADLRAQLRAAGRDKRPPPRGPLGALRALLDPEPSPLLGAPPPYEVRRHATPPAPTEDRLDDGGALVLDQPILLPPRREAFGQRQEATPPLRAAPLAAPPLEVETVGAIPRPRPPLALRIEEAIEAPFHPEDLCDPSNARTDRLYADAGLGAPPPIPEAPPSPSAGESVLLALERRLLEEHMTVIRALAGA